MSYVINTTGTSPVNFLESEVGLVLKTAEIPQTMGKADGTKVIVPAGTVFPADDATAKGIIFHDVDVTSGNVAGSIMVAGRVLTERLSITATAQKALTDIRFVAANEVTR